MKADSYLKIFNTNILFLREIPRRKQMTLVSFVYCLVLVTTLISQTSANGEVLYKQKYHYFCNDGAGNYTHNFSYGKNLNTLLSMLTNNTKIDYGFYNFTYGENYDKVYAIGLCRGDVNPGECRNCLVVSASKLTELCPNQKEAIGWYEEEKCMLRYSDRSIFNLMEARPGYYYHSRENATDLDQFNKSVNTLLSNLKGQASSGDSLFKYAAQNISAPDNKVIYGLAQCTPDLLGSQCDRCLDKSIQLIPITCKDRTGCRILTPSCNLRFETSFTFYGPTAYSPPQPPGKHDTAIIVITEAISVVVSVVFIYICICPRRKQWEKFETQQEEYGGEIDISESLQFSFNTIQDATNDFSDSNKLGQGGFGAVYRGKLSNGQDIAVKRMSTNSGQGDKEFKNEVLLVAKLQHRNLVRLLGFCLAGRERLLVYEFVPNKSLDHFIFHQTKREQLDWQMRYKIIASIARGILYLHQDSRLRIIHRDLKLSNILLDEEMNPKISDFGLARLFVENQTHGDTNRVVGTYGYMAPEYAMRGQFSQKSDVFSFGVLILEVVSGQKNSGTRHGENKEDLLTFAWRNWKDGTATNVKDPTLNNGSQDEIMRCIHIGLLCVQENVADRPTMASVVLMLNRDSLALPVPLEPPLYLDNRTGNVPDMQLWEFNSGTRSSEHSTKSAQESINEVSITDPYPR